MVFFGWSPEYSVHIKELDDQHKKLLVMMNEVYSAIQEKQGYFNISRFLSEMSEYAIAHFSKEEQLLKKYEYGELEAQQKEHNLFFDQITIFKTRLEDGDPDVMDEIAEYLSLWLSGHIIGHDKKYSDFLNGNGVT